MAAADVLDQLRAHARGDVVVPINPFGAPTSVPRVGAYARISDAYEDSETGITEDGVRRQLQACKHIAAARGWVIVREYVDNDVSAFKANVVRDEFEALLDDLRAGLIDGIVCYNLDRFARQVLDLERAIVIYDNARRRKEQLVFATAEGDLNLASDDGLTLARVMVAFANKASRDSARRLALKHQEERDKGRPWFPRRPFGLTKELGDDGAWRWVLDEAESALIKEAAEALTAGTATWVSLAKSWNGRGFKTTMGKDWLPSAVRSVMENPRLAGWQVHRRQIAKHSRTGELVRADLPAVLTDDEYAALMVTLDEKRRKRTRSVERRYLLAGLARCAECGARLYGHVIKRSTKNGEKSYFYYGCSRNDRQRDGITAGCGGVNFPVAPLDELVVELVLPRLIEDSSGLTLDAEKPHAAELHELQTKKDQLLADYRAERATSELVFPKVTRIERRIEAIRHRQAEWQADQRGAAKGAAITRENWGDLPLEEQAGHIARYVEAIYVSKATTRRGRSYDISRVSLPVWRTRVERAVFPRAVPA